MSDDDFDLSLDSVFPEPPRPPTPEPTSSIYRREERFVENGDNGWTQLEIGLVGEHPLWGQYLWNAARSFASYLDEHKELYRGKNVLELGAAGALPSLVTSKNGAQFVVVTDYPDTSLIENIEKNIKLNLNEEEQKRSVAQGFIWGQKTDALVKATSAATGRGDFDLIILSDLIFNHSQHDALLTTCESVLASPSADATPCVLVFYSHHRPQYADRDMLFFSKAAERGWVVTKVVEERFPPMFPEDSGDETVRSTVHGWSLTRDFSAASTTSS